ncbi:hypothetical protein VCSRO182_3433 [Vibrio cholerae]|nr:hypothetical protein VCSRO182_3433 [Vibrio cholerae]
MKKILLEAFILSISFSAEAYTVDYVVSELNKIDYTLRTEAFIYANCSNLYKWPPIFGHDFKWSICFDSTQQYRDRL